MKRNPKDEPRRQILKELVDESGGHAEFVTKFKLTPSQASQVSQIVNGYSFGEKAAETLRQVLKLPVGYFESEDIAAPDLSRDQKKALVLMGRIGKEATDAWLKIGDILASLTPTANAVDTGQPKPIESRPERSLGSDIPPDLHDTSAYSHGPVGEIEKPKEIKKK